MVPFRKEPTPLLQENQASALENCEFVDEALDDLLVDSCVKQVEVQ